MFRCVQWPIKQYISLIPSCFYRVGYQIDFLLVMRLKSLWKFKRLRLNVETLAHERAGNLHHSVRSNLFGVSSAQQYRFHRFGENSSNLHHIVLGHQQGRKWKLHLCLHRFLLAKVPDWRCRTESGRQVQKAHKKTKIVHFSISAVHLNKNVFGPALFLAFLTVFELF